MVWREMCVTISCGSYTLCLVCFSCPKLAAACIVGICIFPIKQKIIRYKILVIDFNLKGREKLVHYISAEHAPLFQLAF